MADEYANVTINGKTFDVRVPKGSDDEYVIKAAQDHYNTKYATESGPSLPTIKPPTLPGMRTPAPVNEDIQSALKGPVQEPEQRGFLGSLKDSASGMYDMVRHPIDTLHGIYNLGNPDPQDIKQYNDPHTPEDLKRQMQYSQLSQFPGLSTANKAVTGDIPGAAGDIAPYAALGALTSPNVRGALAGGARSIPETIENINANPGMRMRMARGIGGAVGYGIGKWPGMIAGRDIGGPIINPMLHPLDLASGIARGMMRGIPGPEPEPIKTGVNSASTTPVTPPSRGVDIPPSIETQIPKQLGPATQIQMPGGFPAPEDNLEMFRRGSSQAPVQPPNYRNPATIYGKELQASGPRVLSPQEVEQLRIKSSSEQNPPKELDQQVPANVESTNKDLPSSKALDIANPKSSLGPKALEAIKKITVRKPSEVVEKGISDPEERLSKAFEGKDKKVGSVKKTKELNEGSENNTITSPDSNKKPHFTHKILGDIAKSISDDKNKIDMTKVGRWVHEHDYGTYEPAKFGERNFGAERNTKTEPSKDKKQLSALNDTLIEAGIKKYIKDNPKKF